MILNYFKDAENHHEPIKLEAFGNNGLDLSLNLAAVYCVVARKNAIFTIDRDLKNQKIIVFNPGFEQTIRIFFSFNKQMLFSILNDSFFLPDSIIIHDNRYKFHGKDARENYQFIENFIKVTQRRFSLELILLSHDLNFQHWLIDFHLKFKENIGSDVIVYLPIEREIEPENNEDESTFKTEYVEKPISLPYIITDPIFNEIKEQIVKERASKRVSIVSNQVNCLFYRSTTTRANITNFFSTNFSQITEFDSTIETTFFFLFFLAKHDKNRP